MSEVDKVDNIEQWKDVYINGKLTNYLVSNHGKVFSKSTKRILAPTKNKEYPQVKISASNREYTRKIHRLIAEAFIPNPDNKPEINHKDGNRGNNELTNLEWVTHSENVKHAYDTGLTKIRHGINASNSKYNDEQIHEVCKLLEEDKGNRYIVSKTGVGDSAISNIKNGRQWTHISSQYDLSKPRKRILYDEDTIHKVCKALEEDKNKRYTEIAKALNVHTHLVKDIKYRNTRKDISKDYNF